MSVQVEEYGSSQKDQGLGWGRSLPVESVQEMVRRDSRSIPDRYIRDHVDRPKKTDYHPFSVEIPVIDFSLLSSRDKDEQKKLHLACRIGASSSLQMINHGITENLLQKTETAATGFFELPLEEKKKHAMASDDLQGYGQAYVVSEQQKLDWGDLLFLTTQPTENRKLNYWPITVTGFMEAIDAYTTEVNRVAKELFANLSLMMKMSEDTLLGLHGEMKQGIRMNYYPKCCRPDLVLGVSPHSDGSSLTILWQDDEIIGLQIQHEDHWVPVKPIPNALVVNAGDIIEAWSNGTYKSIEHRAITNETKERMSLATFLFPDPGMEVGPLDTMVDEQRPRKYKKFKYIDYLRHTLDRKMQGKSHTQFMKLESE